MDMWPPQNAFEMLDWMLKLQAILHVSKNAEHITKSKQADLAPDVTLPRIEGTSLFA